MADPLRKVRPGQELADNLTAAAWNAFVDAAVAHRAGQLQQLGGTPGFGVDSNTIVIRNDSGANRDRYDILAPTGVVFTPADNLKSFQSRVAWIGSLPTLAHFGKFALLLEPAATGRYARAAVGGSWLAKVQVDHIQHAYADVAASSARLTSNWCGSAELLYQETGTGEKWAVVRLNQPFYGPLKGIIAEPGGIAPGGSGDVTVWWAGAESSPASTITAHYNWMTGGDAQEGTEVFVWWFRDEQRFVIGNMGCAT